MSPHITTTVVALKTVTLVMGGAITYFAYSAYRRTGAPALRALAVGFGAITLGALLGGAADQIFMLEGSIALAIESALNAVGFGIILYSLFAK